MNTRLERLDDFEGSGADATTTQLAGSAFATTSSLPSLINERYRLVHELGRGGMAVVYLAEDLTTGQQVALKTMSTRLTGTAKQRFTREFSTIASIQHPHCLKVYEYGETQAGPFFAMELFPGEAATALIGQPSEVILKAIYELSDAIDFVHSRRIIHRDIKPGNMLVKRAAGDQGFEVRITDFGLAKFANTSSSMSNDTNFLGTIAYCAPEQIMREDLDQRADIYAFGMVCYELLSGRHPFHEVRNQVQSLISHHLRQDPVHLDKLNADLDRKISDLIMRMLSKEPSRRPKSLVKLRQRIGKLLGFSEVEGSEDSVAAHQSRKIAPGFVGREYERQELESLVKSCLNPSQDDMAEWRLELPPTAVFVTGEAGIGKTSLMRQAARTALIEGGRIYEGRCFEGNLAPFQPVVEIVKQLLIEQNKFHSKADDSAFESALATTSLLQAGDATTQVDEILENYAPELHRIGPELRNWLPGKAFEQAEMAQESNYIYRAVATFFIELAKLQPTCLLLEDLHWADQASQTLLRHICAAIDDARLAVSRSAGLPCRLFVCATSRAGRQYEAIEKFMDGTPRTRRYDLQAFSAQAMRELIASAIGAPETAIDETLVTQVSQQCMGNPFYVTSSLKEWQSQGKLLNRDGTWALQSASSDDSSVSISVHDGLQARIRALDKVPLQVASVAAVIGKVVEVNLLQEVLSDLSEFELLDALDDLFSRRILVESRQARRVEFTHDLVRDVTLEQISQSRKRAWHRRVGRALEQAVAAGRDVPLGKLAEHFRASGEEQKAFGYLLEAGEEALRTFAHKDAVTLLENAYASLSGDTSQEEKFRLWYALGSAYVPGEHPDEAEKYFKRALEVAESAEDFARATFGYSSLLLRQNRVPAGIELTDAGFSRLGYKIRSNWIACLWDVLFANACALVSPRWLTNMMIRADNSERQRLICDLLHNRSLSEYQRNIPSYMHVSALVFVESHRSNVPRYQALGYAKHALNMAFLGHFRASLRMLKEAERLANTMNEPDPEMRAYTIGLRGFGEYLNGDLVAAESSLMKSFEKYQRLGESFFRLMVVHCMRHVYEVTGNVKAETKFANEELRMANITHDPEKLAWANYGLANVCARSGRLQEADERSLQSLELLENATATLSIPICWSTRGFVLLQMSQYERAEQILFETIQWMHRTLTTCDFNGRAYPLAIEAILGPVWNHRIALSAKRKKQLRRLRLQSVAAGFIFKNVRHHCYRARGRAAAARGKLKASVKLFTRAIQRAEKHGARYEHARALLDRSLVNPPTADEDRRLAFEILEEIGCVIPDAEMKNFVG